VKCDAARPKCERCIKYGIACPGYPEPNALIFRNDTELVRERASRKYEKRRRAQASQNTKSLRESNSSASSESPGKIQPAPPPEVTTGLRFPTRHTSPLAQLSRPGLLQGAVAAFLTQWSVPDPDVFWGAFDTASDLYRSSSPDSCFRAATEAVSLITLSLPKDAHKYDVRRSAMRSYGVALSSINKALDKPEQRVSDHTFMAVMFVSVFEVRLAHCVGFVSG
jgi:hypothetical protein